MKIEHEYETIFVLLITLQQSVQVWSIKLKGSNCLLVKISSYCLLAVYGLLWIRGLLGAWTWWSLLTQIPVFLHHPRSRMNSWDLDEHEISTQCWFNGGPPSQTVAQHWISTGWTSHVDVSCVLSLPPRTNHSSSNFQIIPYKIYLFFKLK